MIDYSITKGIKLDNVYFALLTPKIFRTNNYGGNKESNLDQFNPMGARYFCYIMDEYNSYENIKRDLPHRVLSDKEWQIVENNIGWITFDDIYKSAVDFNTLPSDVNKEIFEFFSTRNLILKL